MNTDPQFTRRNAHQPHSYPVTNARHIPVDESKKPQKILAGKGLSIYVIFKLIFSLARSSTKSCNIYLCVDPWLCYEGLVNEEVHI
jgi:hypothetical protein